MPSENTKESNVEKRELFMQQSVDIRMLIRVEIGIEEIIVKMINRWRAHTWVRKLTYFIRVWMNI